MTEAGKAAREAARARSERFRERRRHTRLLVPVEVSCDTRRALERMGLIAPGHDADKRSVAWAVERFLDTAPAVAAIGDALYPNVEDFFGSAEDSAPEGEARNDVT